MGKKYVANAFHNRSLIDKNKGGGGGGGESAKILVCTGEEKCSDIAQYLTDKTYDMIIYNKPGEYGSVYNFVAQSRSATDPEGFFGGYDKVVFSCVNVGSLDVDNNPIIQHAYLAFNSSFTGLLNTIPVKTHRIY